MVGQKVGEEIDHSSCIWRMNNAPTKGFEEDVGHVTMVRVVSHTSVPLLLKNPDYFFKEASDTIYVIWGPFRNMRKDGNGIVYNMLKKTVDNYPNAQIYVTTEQRMSYCDGVFKEETGKDRWVPSGTASLTFIVVYGESLSYYQMNSYFLNQFLHGFDCYDGCRSQQGGSINSTHTAFCLLHFNSLKLREMVDSSPKCP